MTENQITVALERFKPYLPTSKSGEIVSPSGVTLRSKLKAANPDCMDGLMRIRLKSRAAAILFAVFLGSIGVARFYLGDKGIGIWRIIMTVLTSILSFVPILNIIISIVSFIWIVMDIFLVATRVKQVNFNIVSSFLDLDELRRKQYAKTND